MLVKLWDEDFIFRYSHFATNMVVEAVHRMQALRVKLADTNLVWCSQSGINKDWQSDQSEGVIRLTRCVLTNDKLLY